MSSRWPVVILVLDALVFLGLGVAFTLRPSWIESVDVTVLSPAGTTELRAMYGGLELGAGVFGLLAARRADWRAAGLAFMALSIGGLGLVRLAGILSGGSSPALWGLFAAELVGATTSVLAWRALTPGQLGRRLL